MSEARNALVRALGQVDGVVLRARAMQDQHRPLVGAAAGGFVAGILLWYVLPGAIARSLPESWGVLQWMAERTLGCENERCVDRIAGKTEQPQQVCFQSPAIEHARPSPQEANVPESDPAELTARPRSGTILAPPKRMFELRFLSGADYRHLPDRHRQSMEIGPLAACPFLKT